MSVKENYSWGSVGVAIQRLLLKGDRAAAVQHAKSSMKLSTEEAEDFVATWCKNMGI